RAVSGPMRRHSAVAARERGVPGVSARHAVIARGFMALYRNAPIGIARVSPQGRFLRGNKAMTRLLGYAERELRALNFDDVTHPDDVEHCRRLFLRVQRGEIDRFEMEKRFVRKDGA